MTPANVHKYNRKLSIKQPSLKAIGKRDFMRLLMIMDPIPDRFYIIMEFFVAESQKFLLMKRLRAATTAIFFCPQGDHCGEVQLYLKIRWKSKIIMNTYM